MTNDKPHTPPYLDAIYRWFDAWLEQPLTERERFLIRETFHVIEYPRALESDKLAETQTTENNN